MVLDLTCTMALSDSVLAVAAVDIVAATILIGGNKRANVAAALFVAMQPVYIAGYYLGLRDGTVYVLIDLIAYAQCAVLGGWDVGIRRLFRALRRWVHPSPNTAKVWGNAQVNLGRSTQVFSRNRRGQ
jgi:hypothetical protein